MGSIIVFPYFRAKLTDMKTFILSILLAFPFISLAGKTFTVTITVNQLDGMKPLKGVTVQFLNEDNEIVSLALTDENGKATFSECKEKMFDLVCLSPDKTLKTQTVFCYNPDKKDINEEVNLAYEGERETEFIKSKMSFGTVDTAQISSDSCELKFAIAEYSGGRKELVKFLTRNITVPSIAEELGIQGKVYLKFIIDSNGAMSGLHVSRGIPDCTECDMEALRVLAYMPDWIPATCNGENIAIWYTLPIAFHVE